MTTTVIINHTNKECYIENVDDRLVEVKYKGDIHSYIKDSYDLEGVEYSYDTVNEVLDYSPENREVKIEKIY